jgi:SAM-dependent methyltransferase
MNNEARQYRDIRRARWNQAYQERRTAGRAGAAYHHRLQEIFRALVPAGRRVLEIGCGNGRLLASLQPRFGVGVDFSRAALEAGRHAYPGLVYVEADAHDLPLTGPFDYVILSDLLNDVWDVQRVLAEVRRVCHGRTRILVNAYSRVWEAPLRLLQRLGLSTSLLTQNWLTVGDLRNLLMLSRCETIRAWPEVLLPLPIPGLGPLVNRVLMRLWPLSVGAVSNVLVARAAPQPIDQVRPPVVSVIVPARNEAGRIREIIDRIPEMAGGTEIIFVEGHSRDGTYDAIQAAIGESARGPIRLLRQPGEGKGDAVRAGFAEARGEILAILDADLTVLPEDLPRFVNALLEGQAEFANGVRLVYPMASGAMRLANLVANKAFGWLFSWVLGQPVKDTLCGTKVLWRTDYAQIAANRQVFGDFDPFGDFDLLFGAARLHYKIVDIPVRYGERTYGTTNIKRWRHGVLLARMAFIGARRLRFI